MPTEHTWVPPELMVKTARGPIFHAYKDDDADRVLEYWFTTDENEAPEYEFDIRELPEYGREISRARSFKTILSMAAAKGEIKFPVEVTNG
jgi:hypothetical protein